MSPPRLMVLGGGGSQVPLLRRAHEEGVHVILVDGADQPPGRAWCDTFVQVSTFDVDGVTGAIRKTKPDGVAVVGTDQPVLTAAVASYRAGVPYPLSPETALAVTNKAVMKKVCRDAGLPVPASVLIDSAPTAADLKALSPPYVIKPVDSQGQRGVSLCADLTELRHRYPDALAWTRADHVMVEEYVPSREVTVTGWVTGGVAEILTITDRITVPPGTCLGVCLGHRYPSEYARGREVEVRDLTCRVCDAFEIPEGPLYFQFLVADSGVLVNEVACRLGGAYEDQSVPLVTGVDLLSRQLTLSLGHTGWRSGASLPGANRLNAFVVPLVFARPGVVQFYEPLEAALAVPGVHAVDYLLPVGTEIRPLRNSTQRIAYAVVAGDTRTAVNRSLEQLFEHLGAYDAGGGNLIDNRVADISFSTSL